MIEESAIEFEHEVEDTEEVVDKFKEFLDEVTPDDFAAGRLLTERRGSALRIVGGRAATIRSTSSLE